MPRSTAAGICILLIKPLLNKNLLDPSPDEQLKLQYVAAAAAGTNLVYEEIGSRSRILALKLL